MIGKHLRNQVKEKEIDEKERSSDNQRKIYNCEIKGPRLTEKRLETRSARRTMKRQG